MDTISVNIRILDSRLGSKFLFPEYLSNQYSSFFLKACVKRVIYLMPNNTTLISTGISINIMGETPNIMIQPLLKKKKKYRIIVGHSFFFVNFLYLGELKISLWNCSKKDIQINPGDKIAQLLVNSNKMIKFIYI